MPLQLNRYHQHWPASFLERDWAILLLQLSFHPEAPANTLRAPPLVYKSSPIIIIHPLSAEWETAEKVREQYTKHIFLLS